MPLPVTGLLSYDGNVHSPFSGLAAETDDGANSGDATLLFIYYGDASTWDHISPRVAEQLSTDAEDFEPDELVDNLSFDGGFVMAVDTGWNGVNYYGFAPFAVNEE